MCRAITGGTSYSQHAYGLALDVNTFQNPYAADGLVHARSWPPRTSPAIGYGPAW